MTIVGVACSIRSDFWDVVSVVWDDVVRLVLPINPGSQKVADAVIIDIVPHVDTSIGEIHYCKVKFMLDSSQHFPLNRPRARMFLDDIKDSRHCGWQRQVCHRAFLPKVESQFGESGDERSKKGTDLFLARPPKKSTKIRHRQFIPPCMNRQGRGRPISRAELYQGRKMARRDSVLLSLIYQTGFFYNYIA
jgi:hypothetical protein